MLPNLGSYLVDLSGKFRVVVILHGSIKKIAERADNNLRALPLLAGDQPLDCEIQGMRVNRLDQVLQETGFFAQRQIGI